MCVDALHFKILTSQSTIFQSCQDFFKKLGTVQGSKIALVRSYLQVPQTAGQVQILIFLVKIEFSPMYANIFAM